MKYKDIPNKKRDDYEYMIKLREEIQETDYEEDDLKRIENQIYNLEKKRDAGLKRDIQAKEAAEIKAKRAVELQEKRDLKAKETLKAQAGKIKEMERLKQLKVLRNWSLIPKKYLKPSVDEEQEAADYLLAKKIEWEDTLSGAELALEESYIKLTVVIESLLDQHIVRKDNYDKNTLSAVDDLKNEQWLLDNIVFLNTGYYNIDAGIAFKSRNILNDYIGEYSLIEETDNGSKTTIPINRIINNPKKLTAPGGIVWMPVARDDYKTVDTIEGEVTVNTYKPFELKGKEGDVDLFLELIMFICGDYTQDVLQHMAFTIQHPEKKIIWQILIYDEVRRNGKSAIFKILELILGKLCEIVLPELAKSGWGDIFLKKKVVIFEEIWGFDQSMFNNIKAKLSNDNFESINVKNGDIVRQANRYSMYMLSNHDDALQMSENEDKVLVIKGPGCFIKGDTLDQESRDWYKKYWSWVRSDDGISALTHFFNNYDISDFNYQSPPDRTAALRETTTSAAPIYEQKMEQWWADRVSPFDCYGVIAAQIYEQFGLGERPKSQKSVWKKLKTMGFETYVGQKRENGSKYSVRFWGLKEDLDGLRPRELYEIYNRKRDDAQLDGTELMQGFKKSAFGGKHLTLVTADKDDDILD